ncbi:MAG: hypothetical protein JXR62_05300, partial [Bacilli bacterium]|nr:hypothetical protein [Bacilli bacterium]
MIVLSNEFLKKNLLTKMWDESRKLEYYLLLRFLEDTDQEIVNELKKYQNDDGGFGHGLEPDIRLPFSNVASTDIAVYALDFVKDFFVKEEMIQRIVNYYENCFDYDNKSWTIVPQTVDDFPRAVWWNFSNVNSFTYGNPNPEIIGFLYQNRRYLTKIDIVAQINKVIE